MHFLLNYQLHIKSTLLYLTSLFRPNYSRLHYFYNFVELGRPYWVGLPYSTLFGNFLAIKLTILCFFAVRVFPFTFNYFCRAHYFKELLNYLIRASFAPCCHEYSFAAGKLNKFAKMSCNTKQYCRNVLFGKTFFDQNINFFHKIKCPRVFCYFSPRILLTRLKVQVGVMPCPSFV